MSDLDALRSLTEVVRCGSVSEAARRLGLSQPAVSGHLKQLEERLGRALTRRKGRGVEPTAVARELAARTGPAMDMLADALEDVAEIAARPVRMGGPRVYLLARAIPILAERSDAPLRVSFETDPARLVEMMEDGELDLGVFSTRPDPARVEAKELELDRPTLVAHPKFAELAGKPIIEILEAAPALSSDPRLSDLARHMQEGLDEPRLAHRTAPPAMMAPDADALLSAARVGA
ncbi:MAG: LysR family transcriptional regulator, partial [Caulobacterales bacterium]|nr:LysR family transcriptional regulator [Caulobacterales bacterium]